VFNTPICGKGVVFFFFFFLLLYDSTSAFFLDARTVPLTIHSSIKIGLILEYSPVPCGLRHFLSDPFNPTKAAHSVESYPFGIRHSIREITSPLKILVFQRSHEILPQLPPFLPSSVPLLSFPSCNPRYLSRRLDLP